MSLDKIFDVTAGVYFNFYNIMQFSDCQQEGDVLCCGRGRTLFCAYFFRFRDSTLSPVLRTKDQRWTVIFFFFFGFFFFRCNKLYLLKTCLFYSFIGLNFYFQGILMVRSSREQFFFFRVRNKISPRVAWECNEAPHLRAARKKPCIATPRSCLRVPPSPSISGIVV